MRLLMAMSALLLVAAATALDAPTQPSAAPTTAPRMTESHPGLAPPPSACLASGGPPPTDVEDLLIVPLSQFTVEVRGPASDVRLVVALCTGSSLLGRLTGPEECTGAGSMMTTNVVGVSNGQRLAELRCPALGPGTHTFLIDSGASTFSGQARVWNARFA